MEYTGTNLALDVEGVWRAAVETFPNMALAYYNATVWMEQTRETQDQFSESFPKWQQFRDGVQSVLSWQGQILRDTGAAVQQAIQSYVDGDDAAAAALENVFATGGQTGQPPPRVAPQVPEPISPPSHGGREPSPSADVGKPKVDSYDGGAPTIKELTALASKLDQKLWDAYDSEEGLLESMVPDSWVENSIDAAGGYSYYIVDLIKKLARIDPAEYNSAVRCLEELVGDPLSFESFFADVLRATESFGQGDWAGKTAENFRQYFLIEYGGIANNQLRAVGELLGAVKGLQEARAKAHEQYKAIMDAAIESCESIIQAQSAADKSFAGSVLSATFGVVATVATGGSAKAVDWALASAGISVGLGTASLSGENTEKLHVSVMKALNEAHEKLHEFDVKLAKALVKDTNDLESLRASPEPDVDLPRPAFLDDPSLL